MQASNTELPAASGVQLNDRDPDRLLTRSQARHYIPVSDVTFQRMEQRGALVPVRFPGSNRPYYRLGDVLSAAKGGA